MLRPFENKLKNKILFFGPYSPPYTGQFMAFRSVVDSYSSEELLLVNTSKLGNRYLNTIHSIIQLIWIFARGNQFESAYFTCTRSFSGSLKDLVLLSFCKWKKIRVINHLHGADFKNFVRTYPPFLKTYLFKCYRSIRTSIVLMPSMAQEFEDFPEMSVKVVLNFYPSEFDEVKNPSKESFTVTYFSNLLFSKGIFDFLEAASILKNHNEDIDFKIAGSFQSDHLMTEREVRDKFQKIISEKNLESIEFWDQISPNQRVSFLTDSDILVLPTYYPTEASPLVIIEAMRCGNAIITTDHNYLPDLINVKNGVIVAPKQPNQIASAISKFKKDIAHLREIQSHNVNVAKAKYSESRYIQEVREIIATGSH